MMTSSQAVALQSYSEPHLRVQGRFPIAPDALDAMGLPEGFIGNLIIKHLYHYSILTGVEIAEKIAMPFTLIDRILDEIISLKYAEKRGGRGLGNATDRFSLTERGRENARDLLNHDTYVGPTPVTMDEYTRYVREQSLVNIRYSKKELTDAWSDFVLDEEFYALIGPAINSGKSCFLYGPPGTGKTTIAKRISSFINFYGGSVAIPHAIYVGGSVIRVFDDSYHVPIEGNEDLIDGEVVIENSIWAQTGLGDRRWVICARPTIISGGELTLEMLDLRYNQVTNYYEAPIQMKANGGVLIIDDFGRQLVRPKDLLNRWIVPLEERTDFLTLHTGKKFPIPFEQLVIFATNLNPLDLVDEAFLRRIRYKIYIGEPSQSMFKRIFAAECRKKGIQYQEADLDEIIRIFYTDMKRPLRTCDPRDITDRLVDYCSYYQYSYSVNAETLEYVVASYLSDIRTSPKSKAIEK